MRHIEPLALAKVSALGVEVHIVIWAGQDVLQIPASVLFLTRTRCRRRPTHFDQTSNLLLAECGNVHAALGLAESAQRAK